MVRIKAMAMSGMMILYILIRGLEDQKRYYTICVSFSHAVGLSMRRFCGGGGGFLLPAPVYPRGFSDV